jgi:acylphosphatase
MTVTKHLSIRGVVQGVGYRASFYYAAKRAGVSGWVRNRRDGTVEAMIHGSEGAVNEVIEWSRRGPDLARVDDVAITDAAETFSDFSIEDTL